MADKRKHLSLDYDELLQSLQGGGGEPELNVPAQEITLVEIRKNYIDEISLTAARELANYPILETGTCTRQRRGLYMIGLVREFPASAMIVLR